LLGYLLICVGWVLLVDAFVGENGLSALIQARREYRALDESLAVVRTENGRLRKEARRLREDSATIEEFARRELVLIRPGETLFTIRSVPAPAPR
jgi:cell division protein FtsB